MRTHSKRCPRCDAAIEKSGGCNKVVCGFCRCIMCWKCGREIHGYDHFKKRCRLFDEAEEQAWQDEWEGMVEAHNAA